MLVLATVAVACGKDQTEDKPAESKIVGGIKEIEAEPKSEVSVDVKEGPEQEESAMKIYTPDFVINEEGVGFRTLSLSDSALLICYPGQGSDVYAREVGKMRYNLWLFEGSDSYSDEAFEGMENKDIIEKIPADSIYYIPAGNQSASIDGDFDRFEFDTTEEVTINGIDMIRYEGEMVVTGYRDSNKRHVVLYAFMYAGRPCVVAGCVKDYKQEPLEVAEMKNNIELMIKTIQPHPEKQPVPLGESHLSGRGHTFEPVVTEAPEEEIKELEPKEFQIFEGELSYAEGERFFASGEYRYKTILFDTYFAGTTHHILTLLESKEGNVDYNLNLRYLFKKDGKGDWKQDTKGYITAISGGQTSVAISTVYSKINTYDTLLLEVTDDNIGEFNIPIDKDLTYETKIDGRNITLIVTNNGKLNGALSAYALLLKKGDELVEIKHDQFVQAEAYMEAGGSVEYNIRSDYDFDTVEVYLSSWTNESFND